MTLLLKTFNRGKKQGIESIAINTEQEIKTMSTNEHTKILKSILNKKYMVRN
jgi:hypothetical protein